MTIVDILDDDAEGDKKCVKEQCLPVDSPLLCTCHKDDVCASEMFHVLPKGGTGDLVIIVFSPLESILLGKKIETLRLQLYDVKLVFYLLDSGRQ